MNNRVFSIDAFQRLREKAEQILKEGGSKPPDMDKNDLPDLIHELEVHHVELEVQNDELRLAKTALEASRDEFSDLYESAPVAYVTLNHKGIIQRANKAANEMLIKAGRTLVGTPFFMLVHKEDFSLYSSYIEKIAHRSWAAGPIELRLRAMNREIIHVQMQASLKGAKEEGPNHWLLTLMDVTKRRQMEEELRRSRNELEQRVKEMQEFIYIASHDLQEPLRKVRTFGEMLATRSGDLLEEASRDYLKRMQTTAERMQHLLNSLLAYSRVTTRADSSKRTDLGRSVEAALSNMEIAMKESNARIEAGPLPTVMAERVQMVQLFQNLIGNAFKFHRDGEAPHVKIFARQIGNKFYEIHVEDNGIGFEEEYAEKIFVPFQRLHGRSSYEGVGIGLAICKKIMERHGGSITAKSQMGKGSTFIVTFPAEGKVS